MGESVFPSPSQFPKKSHERWGAATRRECRGLLVDRESGRVLARRFHKFFNLDEFPETTLPRQTPLSENVVVTEKVDGSLVSPFLEGGEMKWATRVAPCEGVAPFVEQNAPNIGELSRLLLEV